ncbi:MAG: UvrD-helicase domain-containing protein [Pirellulales bacterium]|nr:UvrD-helicase domain-containing protein [Pirellulales bacterium]
MPATESLPPRPTYTAEQSAAIAARDISVALSAGAGCGKTFVLTERFLSHLQPAKSGRDKPVRLSQLVAITFTERAAREMRDRVRKACYERLRQCPEDEVEHWRELLRELDSARISTIHSFCGSLLRSHAVEAGLDPRFRVLDAAQSDTLLFELIDRGLRRRLADRDEAVIELIVKYGLDRLREMVGLFLDWRQDIDWAAWREKTPEELTALWENYFREAVFPKMLREFVDSPDGRTVQKIAGLTPCPCSHATMQERMRIILEAFTKLSADRSSPANAAEVFAELENLHAAARVQGAGIKHWSDGEAYTRFSEAAKAFRDRIKAFQNKAAFDADAALPVAEMGVRLLHLSEEIAAEYEREKQGLSVLDFNDLLIHARRLLVGPEKKMLRRRWAEHLRLLLVDEFQDTDPLQVELVKALCDNEVTRGKLFFVGDFKQSIYRFRGADPHVFRLLREEVPERGRLPLSENFRSTPGVIEFVNALFAEEFEGYEPLRAHRAEIIPPPAVEFLWAMEEVGEPERPRPRPTDSPSLPESSELDDSTPVERRRRREADWIARRIRQMLDGGEKLVGDRDAEKAGTPTARAVKPGDIAILFRALTDVAYYEEALRRHGIDYYLVGGHAFYAQQEVYDLMNLLRALESPCDEVALVGVLRSPFFCLLDETIFWLARHPQGLHGGLFAEKLPPELDAEQAARAQFAAETLRELRAMKDRLPVARLIRLALDRTAYDAILLAEFLGERKLANLYKLIEQARSFDESGVFSLSDFIAQLSEFVVRQPKEPLAATQAESMDVVRLMSIHQSKGLEFPVVFVADLDRPLRSRPPAAVFSPVLGPLIKDAEIASGFNLFMQAENKEDRDEAVRLFYVAATRAADYLVLSAGFDPPKAENEGEDRKQTHDFKPKGEWLQLLARHFDPLTGQPIQEGRPVKVITSKPELQKQPEDITVHRRLKTVEEKTREMAEKEEGLWPPYLDALAADENARRQLSFSRLSGKLHRAIPANRDGPAPDIFATDAAIEIDSAAEPRIDPLGLGTLVHAVLAEVDFADPKNLPALVERHAAEHVGDERAAVAQAVEMLERFTNSERAKEIAAAKQVHRELEFLLAWPPDGERSDGRYFQGFIDLLYLDAAGGWHLLDFKTNVVTESNLTEVAANYKLQMLVYALAVEKILKSPPRELTLHFLRTGWEKTFPWDDAARTKVVEMVNDLI